MNMLKKILLNAFLCMSFTVLIAPVYGHETEIFFAQATADNDENQIRANVFLMLDTSGSMRYCQNSLSVSGYNATWCSDAENRRINILQDSLSSLLDQVSPDIHIGVGRFNYPINSSGTGFGQRGGRVLVPVVPVNNLTRPFFDAAIDSVNDAGDNASAPLASAQPVGDTPTARAFSEAARYMMGSAPVFGIADNGFVNQSICVAGTTQQVNCRQEVSEWGAWEVVDFCDVANTDSCRVTGGSWSPIASCNVALDNCRYTSWSSWSGWSSANQGACSNFPSGTCKLEEHTRCTGWVFLGSCIGGSWVTEYRSQTRGYEFFSDSIYESRSPITYTEICDDSFTCTETRSIVANNNYVSPMNLNNQCETNHIILFTDGQPSSNDTPSNLTDVVNCTNLTSYQCQAKIAEWLNSDDNHKGRPVITHNIGLYMGSAQSNMETVSEKGGGSTINADNADELLNAFLATFELIDRTSRSLSSPGVAVNTLNRFQHLDQLYYAVFNPVESTFWDGNLKRYRLVGAEVHGQNGKAVDDDTGFFSETARSFWSSNVDGNQVTQGGAKERLSNRRLFYTDQAGGTIKQLSWASNIPENSFFGITDSAERTRMMDLLKTNWGDPLHSAPVMVNYGTTENNNVVFVSTNAGMLHAIDTHTGNELFSFMPNELFAKATAFTTRRPGLNVDNTRQIYGLDGSWVAWRKQGETILDAPEHVYLYGGMRRGGRHLYALDVTDKNNPEMLWQVSNTTPGFEDLGQTWSTPRLTRIPTADGPVPVIVVGGGYSPDDHDFYKDRTSSDQMGNAVYFIHAETGALVYSIGGTTNVDKTVSDMKWSIPGSVSVVDINFNGVADHVYFADLGGQVFRLTFGGFDPITSDPLHQVTRIANLGGTTANHRRFYDAPAIALASGELWVAVGSGYKAHPLNEDTDEAFFVIRDTAALQPVAHVEANLANMSNVTNGSVPSATSRGWYYFLEEGEKVSSSPIIFRNRILFTTYSPTVDQNHDDPCSVRYGASYLHTVSLTTGAAMAIAEGAPLPTDRRTQLKQSTPAPSPTLIVNEEGEVVVLVGTESIGETDIGDTRLRMQRWKQMQADEANKIIDDKWPAADDEETEEEVPGG